MLKARAKFTLVALLTACAASTAPEVPEKPEPRMTITKVSVLPPKRQTRRFRDKELKPKKNALEAAVERCDAMSADDKVRYMFYSVVDRENIIKFDRSHMCAEFSLIQSPPDDEGIFATYARFGLRPGCYQEHLRELKEDKFREQSGIGKRNTAFRDPVLRGMMIVYLPKAGDDVAFYALNPDVPSQPKNFTLFQYRKGKFSGEKCDPDQQDCLGVRKLFNKYISVFCVNQKDIDLKKKLISYTPRR